MCKLLEVSIALVKPILYMQTLKWILFERQNTPKEKKIYHNLIFYMNFSWEEKSLLRTLEG